jgi:hypothetical protein
MRGKASDPADESERPRTFGERGLRNVRSNRSGAGMLSGSHGSMVTTVESGLASASNVILKIDGCFIEWLRSQQVVWRASRV